MPHKQAYAAKDKINVEKWAKNPKLTAVKIPEDQMANFEKLQESHYGTIGLKKMKANSARNCWISFSRQPKEADLFNLS